MATFLWVLIAAFYVVVMITLGLTTLRKGHFFLFFVGFFLPFLWLIGALIGPTPRAAAA
jgi:ATP/ADP translocase